jgi:hypothetical protein
MKTLTPLFGPDLGPWHVIGVLCHGHILRKDSLPVICYGANVILPLTSLGPMGWTRQWA